MQEIRRIMTKRNRTKEETKIVMEHIGTIKNKNEILNFRKRIVLMESDTLPSIMGDIQEGYSPILLVCGRQRIGKTRFGATLANIFSIFLYYEWFDHKKGFYLQPRRLLQELGNYMIYLLDEAGSSGSGLNKRQWFSELAILYDYILQTQGNLINIYIFILPFASDLTTDIRKYIDYLFAGKKRGNFKVYKIYKREDQLVKNLKAFKQVWIENLTFKKSDLPEWIWRPIENKCNEIKVKTKDDIINRMRKKEDWLYG